MECAQKLNEQEKSNSEDGPSTSWGRACKKKKSIIESRQKMRLRVRKYRAKMTAEQIEAKRKYDRDRYKRKKSEGHIKGINELSEREKRLKRKKWRVNSCNYQKRRILQKEQFLINNSPPASASVSNGESSQKKIGRKMVKKSRSLVYRKLKKAQVKIKETLKRLGKYSKRLQRCKLTIKQNSKASPSPNAKVKMLTKGTTVTHEIKKKLLFGEALKAQLTKKSRYIQGNLKAKELFNKFLSGKILKKYRLQKEALSIISYKQNKKYENVQKLNILRYDRQKRSYVLTDYVKNKIIAFLQLEGNSKVCPGKNDYITRGKVTKQKRILLHSLKKLHKTFIEKETIKISYTTFCRYKPFWYIQPSLSQRETCACVKHSNIEFIINKLYYRRIIAEKSSHEMIKNLTCDPDSKNCMYGSCDACIGRRLQIFKKDMDNPEIKYYQWENITEARKVSQTKIKTIKFTTKMEKVNTEEGLIKELELQFINFKIHYYNMKHQFKYLKETKENLKENEIALQIDFSENYVCKFQEEIQAMHFGASKKQISLHTGVTYLSKEKPISFCSVSDNLDHQAYAVWAHLQPILQNYSKTFKNLNMIQFFSDGPTSQYKNRTNIFLLIKLTTQIFPGIKEISWNFSESGHGKGPMDGVGGSLKRAADQLCLTGNDISSASCFVDMLQKKGSSVEIILIPAKNIENMKKYIPSEIPSIPRLMNVRQITWSHKTPRNIYTRILSCLICPFDIVCLHHPAGRGIVEISWTPLIVCNHMEAALEAVADEQGLVTNINKKMEANVDQVMVAKADEEISSVPLPMQVIPTVSVGEWVAVIYGENWYPGVVDSVDEEDNLDITFMVRSGNKFGWPEKEDRQSVKAGNILCKILVPPQPVSSRHFILPTAMDIEELFKKN